MRQPPAFADDPWCWQYTVEKMSANCEKKHGYPLEYEDWESRHFKGACAMYKNIKRKYGTGRAVEATGVPCPRCDVVREFPPNDYICHVCRYGV